MTKFALVGLGNRGNAHLPLITANGELVAVCDSDAVKLQENKNIARVRTFTHFDDMLSKEAEANVVVICTPNGLHAEHIIKSLQAGKHVLCEAPLCITKAAAWQILETQKFCRRKLFIANLLSYSANVLAIKHMLQNKLLGMINGFQLTVNLHPGDAYFSSWRSTVYPGGGHLYTLASQYIQVLIEMFGNLDSVDGSYAVDLSTDEKNFGSESGTMKMTMLSGVQGSFDWKVDLSPGSNKNEFIINGQNGSVTIGGDSWEVADLSAAAIGPVNRVSNKDEYEMTYSQMLESLKSNDKSFAEASSALHTIEVLEMIYKATNRS